MYKDVIDWSFMPLSKILELYEQGNFFPCNDGGCYLWLNWTHKPNLMLNSQPIQNSKFHIV